MQHENNRYFTDTCVHNHRNGELSKSRKLALSHGISDIFGIPYLSRADDLDSSRVVVIWGQESSVTIYSMRMEE